MTGRMTGHSTTPTLRLHATLARSRANGPGLRHVIWLQGCTLGCKGCFNPASHAPGGGREVGVEILAEQVIRQSAGIDGITVSGGEPLQQAPALEGLLRAIRAETALSVLLFTGYRLPEVRAIPQGPAILGLIDVLVAGRYVPKRAVGRALLGSANQKRHFLTERYGPADLEDLPDAELIIDASGAITTSGIAPPRIGQESRITL